MSQEGVARARNRIHKELGELKWELHNLTKFSDEYCLDFAARLRLLRMEWSSIKSICENSIHDDFEKGKICPDCGIEMYGFIFELDI
jgi:hypothetical protein